MYLKIFLLLLLLISSSGFYIFNSQLCVLQTYDSSRMALAISVLLFIIIVTSVIAFIFSMIRKDEENFHDTKVLDRKSLNPSNDQLSDDAIVLLRLLQEEGRLLDFIKEDISSYDDSQVASASRVIHRGCSNVFKKYLSLDHVLDYDENMVVELPENIEQNALKVHGNKTGKIKVIHRGWKITSSDLPKIISNDSKKDLLIVPAEGESI